LKTAHISTPRARVPALHAALGDRKEDILILKLNTLDDIFKQENNEIPSDMVQAGRQAV
jgi:hypothetical protein